MTDDILDSLLGLEDDFYKEGYEAGVTDSSYAGMIEGKVFGIEKGYEKALELAKLRGRALVWQARTKVSSDSTVAPQTVSVGPVQCNLTALIASLRMQKNIEALLALTKEEALPIENSDEAVSDFDERIAKATAKAKVIVNVTGDISNSDKARSAGIEDATGLEARR